MPNKISTLRGNVVNYEKTLFCFDKIPFEMINCGRQGIVVCVDIKPPAANHDDTVFEIM